MKEINVMLAGRKGVAIGSLKSGTAACKAAALAMTFVLTFAGCKKAEGPAVDELATTAKSDAATSAVVPDFTIAVIPDTQYYVSSQNGGTPAMFTSQIDWIKANQAAENIVYVASLGDITDHGNTYASEWTNASTNGYYKLETQTGFPEGIPYGTCVGNHDQTPNTGHPLTCSTSSYNGKFGANRFRPRAYYGESYYGSSSNNNDSHYDLFTAGGIDFIVFYVEYDSHGDDPDVNTWVYNTLGTYAGRKAIIVSHMVINSSGAWGTTGSSYAQAQELWDRIKGRHNVFMFLGGHFTGESTREDTYSLNTIRSYLSDYQGRTNGGNGYMRLMKFSVNNNTVSVKTYSPHLGTYETDANSQFSKPLFTYPIEPVTTPGGTLADGKYKITSRLSGKAIAVLNGSIESEAGIIQYDYSETNDNDEWNVTKLASGYYRITNVKSSLDLNVDKASYLHSAPLIQYAYSNPARNNDEWAIVDVGGGYFKITARHSSLGLNVQGASTANGAAIIQYPYSAVAQCQWQFTTVP